ncbi:MAG: hypothetical protein HQ498_06250 [Pseudohongiella sp.]|nr:hypothetical protein [Pseudohongiella sp.]
MKLSDYAHIAEIASGIAVLVTLLVLVFEVRGNTEAIQAATYGELVGEIASSNWDRATNPDIADLVFLQKTEGYDALSEKQKYQSDEMLITLFQLYDRAYTYWASGNLSDEAWTRFGNPVCNLSNNFDRLISTRSENIVSAQFNEYRKSCVQE